MLKRKRIIALMISLAVFSNTTSGGLNEVKIFAQDMLMQSNETNELQESNTEDTSAEDALAEDEPSSNQNISDNYETQSSSNSIEQDTGALLNNNARAKDIHVAMPSNLILNQDNNIYYINKDSDKVILELTLSDISMLTEDNIDFTGEKPVLLQDPSSPNKYTLELNSFKNNENLTLKFNVDGYTSSYTFFKDTTAPSQLDVNSDNLSYKENNKIYVEQSINSSTLKFSSNEDIHKYEITVDGGNYPTNEVPVSFNPSNTIDTKNITVKATDYSGNSSTFNYEVIRDNNDYLSDILSKVTTKFNDTDFAEFNDTDFANNKIHLRSFDKNDFDFYVNNPAILDMLVFYKDDPSNRLLKYGNKYSDKNIDIDINVENNYKYVIASKNATTTQELNYTICYEPDDLDINMTYDGSSLITPNSVYSNSAKDLEVDINITDEGVIEDIKAITGNITYNGTTTPLTKNDFIKPNDSTKKWVLSIKNKLGTNHLEDGDYDISISVIPKFNNDGTLNVTNTAKEKKLKFSIDSKAPTAKLIVTTTRDGKPYILVDSDDTTEEDNFINPGEESSRKMYIAIHKDDLSPSNRADLKSIKLGDYVTLQEASELTPIDDTIAGYADYKLYPFDTTNFLSENDHNVKLIVEDTAIKVNSSNGNISDLDVDYTIDTTLPQISAFTDNNTSLSFADSKQNALYTNTEKFTAKSDDKYIDNIEASIVGSTNTSNNTNASNGTITTHLDLGDDDYYKFTVTATDKAGNETIQYFDLNKDTKIPTIDMGEFSQPDKLLSDHIPTITAKINESRLITYLSRIIGKPITITEAVPKSVELKVWERNKDKDKDITPIPLDIKNPNLNLAGHIKTQGKYEIELTATDKAENKGTGTGYFIVDTSKADVDIRIPSLGVNQSAEGSLDVEPQSVSSISPEITIEDITTTEEDVSIVLKNTQTGQSYNSDDFNLTLDPSNYKMTYSMPNITSEGIYNLAVKVGDKVKDRAPFTSNVSFAVDRKAPTISVTAGGKQVSPESKIFLNSKDAKNLVATVTDNISELNDIEVKTIIKPNNGSSSENGSSYTFTSDDTYDVEVIATDNANNTSTFKFSVVVDTDIPEIKIQGVNDGQYTNKNVIPDISIDDETAKITLTLNGKPYKKGDPIQREGKYELVVKAEDEAGNIQEIVITFVVDKTKPVITITGIKNNQTYTEGEIKPLIKWDDAEALVTILLNGLDYSGEIIEKDGSYVLVVKAIDKAGNVAEEQFRFKVNLSKPEIKVIGITDNEVYNGPVTIDVNLKDAVDYTILINGTEYEIGDVISKPGTYTMRIVAVDEDGNESEEIINFTIDSIVDASNLDTENKKSIKTAENYKLMAIGAISILSISLIATFYIFITKKNKK